MTDTTKVDPDSKTNQEATVMDTSTIEFTESDVPTTAKPKDVGPFGDKFPLPEGKSLVATFPNNADGQLTVATLVKQARNAASEKGCTARQKQEVVKVKGGKEEIHLTLWTVEKITRPRKNGDAAVAASASNPNTATA